MTNDTTPRLGSTTPLPRIISVDDHVVEPPHLWDTWLPPKFRDRGPRSERRGIGEMEHIGGGTYRQTFDPDGAPAGIACIAPILPVASADSNNAATTRVVPT